MPWFSRRLPVVAILLAAPPRLVAGTGTGTTMPIGVPQAADREDIVAYLKSLAK